MSKRLTRKRKNDLEENALAKEDAIKGTLSSKLATIDKNVDKKAKKEEIEYRHWLMKSEPESRIENGFEMKFGVEDLKASKDKITHWDGVRNYEARNHMKAMKLGHKAFFYHSNCKTPGLVALMTICKESYPDFTAFDKNDAHFDPKSDINNPKWYMVDVQFDRDLKRFISLNELKQYHLMHKKNGGPLANLSLFTRSRLSVQGISDEEWNFIIELEDKSPL
ncbi:thymocyte nuclear 1 isoform X1 [Brachionus plicatilis]|uniref:Thymocyte nuclear protein 1 n=1 Tax=Brachionus plicatilis TaxID=10195 RepID=A0A3M7SS27_BRAPC|nr:thymocyte nuclear 1 isoform X1 [Brachionus plicatilis]